MIFFTELAEEQKEEGTDKFKTRIVRQTHNKLPGSFTTIN